MSDLERELLELFDLRKGKIMKESVLNQEVAEVMKDIKLLTIMFSEGIPDLTVTLNADETLIWDSGSKKIFYSKGEVTQFIEAAEKNTIVRIRPFLPGFVQMAKDQLND